MSHDQRVYVVEDDPAVREVVSELLESAGIRTQTFASGAEFLDSMAPEPGRTCCLILDVRMPEMDGFAVMERLNSRNVYIPTILLTGFGDVRSAVRAMKMGAVDFLEKPFENVRLVERVRRTLDDFSPSVTSVTLEQYRARVSSLTPREHEVMKHMVLGKPGKRIAQDLGISYKTLEKHRSHVLQKMQVGSVALLVRLVMQFQQVNSA